MSASSVQRGDLFLKGFQLVDDLVLRRLRSRIAREVAMDAKTPIIAATATVMSSHMVRGESLPFDCSVMKVRSKTPEYQGLLYAAHSGCIGQSRTSGLAGVPPRRAQILSFT